MRGGGGGGGGGGGTSFGYVLLEPRSLRAYIQIMPLACSSASAREMHEMSGADRQRRDIHRLASSRRASDKLNANAATAGIDIDAAVPSLNGKGCAGA